MTNRKEYDFDLVFDALKAKGISKLVVYFDGQGDQGAIEYCEIDGSYAGDLPDDDLPEPAELTMPSSSWWGVDSEGMITKIVTRLNEAIEEIVYALIYEKHPGWENNDGASGDVVFDVAKRKVTYTHNTRVMSFVSDTYEYGEDEEVAS